MHKGLNNRQKLFISRLSTLTTVLIFLHFLFLNQENLELSTQFNSLFYLKLKCASTSALIPIFYNSPAILF